MSYPPINVTVWNEYRCEKIKPEAGRIYPHGIHETIAAPLREQDDLRVRVATLDDPDQGLSPETLDSTDVLVLWGHRAHDEVTEATVDRAQRRVLEGMGLIVLHSGHGSKLFKRLLGTNGFLKWRAANDKERLWNVLPSHPIAQGLPDHFVLPQEEMYGEPFSIPTPDELIFISWFTGGEVFRSGCTWQRGHGKMFYFRPGHETFPTFHNEFVQRILLNAIRWARPTVRIRDTCPQSAPLEP